jgi:hypothetical protein
MSFAAVLLRVVLEVRRLFAIAVFAVAVAPVLAVFVTLVFALASAFALPVSALSSAFSLPTLALRMVAWYALIALARCDCASYHPSAA